MYHNRCAGFPPAGGVHQVFTCTHAANTLRGAGNFFNAVTLHGAVNVD
jgi:hypothetical protein